VLTSFREEYYRIYSEIDPKNAHITRNSHIFEALHNAISFPYARAGILRKLAVYIFGPEADIGCDLSFWSLSKGISTGDWLRDLVGAEKVIAGEYNG
jgi:hypothetical protein